MTLLGLEPASNQIVTNHIQIYALVLLNPSVGGADFVNNNIITEHEMNEKEAENDHIVKG